MSKQIKIGKEVLEAVAGAFRDFRNEVLIPFSKVAGKEGNSVGKISEETMVALLGKIGSNLNKLDKTLTPKRLLDACKFDK